MDGQSLHSRASQETFISLLQLEPKPMDSDSPVTEKPLPQLPEEASMESSSSKGEEELMSLSSASIQNGGSGGSGPGLISFLTKCQRYSSYTLSIFMSIHLANTSLIPLFTRSVAASEKHLLLAREIYQTPVSEPLLIGLPVLAHVASGVGLRLLRRSQNLRKYGGATPGMHAVDRSRHGTGASAVSVSTVRIWPPLSYISASGYGFAVFFAAHLVMNRVLPLAVEGDSSNIGLAYVSHGFARHAVVASIAYTGLLAVGCGHMVWGAAKWLGLSSQAAWGSGGNGSGSNGLSHSGTHGHVVDRRARRRRRRMWLGIHATAVALTSLWSAGGLGVVARGGLTPGWIGDVYDGLYSEVWL